MNKYKFLILILFGFGFALFLRVDSASALTDTFLDTDGCYPAGNACGAGSGNVSLLVEHTDDVSVPVIQLKWFIRDTYTGNPSLRLNNFCAPGRSNAYIHLSEFTTLVPPDPPNPSSPSWNIFNPNNSNFTQAGYTNRCVGNDLVMPAVLNSRFVKQVSADDGTDLYASYGVVLITIQLLDQTNYGGLTKFNAQVIGGGVNDNIISQAELALRVTDVSDPFSPLTTLDQGGLALVGDLSNTYGYNASFTFRPNCNAFNNGLTTKDFYIYWRDADGWAGYGSSTRMQLRDIGTGALVPMDLRDTSNNPTTVETTATGLQLGDASNQLRWAAVSLQINHRYEWEWENVNQVNVVHIWMPFSETNILAPDCGESNPVGYADSCELIGGTTYIYGWAYDSDATANDENPDVLVNVGAQSSTVPTNIANYRTDGTPEGINPFLEDNGYDATFARDDQYGFVATFTGLNQGNVYAITGTVINEPGNGSDQALGINTDAIRPTNKNPGTFGFVGGIIPDDCLPVPLVPPTCSTSPIVVETGQSFRVSISINNGNPFNSVDINTADYNIVGDPASGSAQPTSGASLTRTLAVGGTMSVRSNLPEIVINTGGSYQVLWTITSSAGNAETAAGGVCEGEVQVRSSSYFRFYGGDVLSCGMGFVRGKSDGSYSAGTYFGSASELAIFAMDEINGVMTGSQATGRSSEWDLSFANTSGTIPPQFGGNFGTCPGSFALPTPTLTDAANRNNLNSETTGVYRNTSGNLQASIIDRGQRIVLTSASHLHIKGNITYQMGWTDVTDIPSFTLIVDGNLYIEGGPNAATAVTQLDGNYIVSGDIFTCAGAGGPTENLIDGTDPQDANYIVTRCNQPLKINGTLSADKIHFLRAVGSVNAGSFRELFSSNNVAEAIRFSPEAFLTEGGGLPEIPSARPKLDSIVARPPSF